MASPKLVALYLRVSTDMQTIDSQLGDLRRYATQRGYEIFHEYRDEGISGAKENRPALSALMLAARQRKFDVVVVWSFSRFSRNLRQLLNALHEFEELRIDFVSFTEGLDTSTAAGRVLFAVVGAFAEFERECTKERVMAGLRAARLRGKRLGRPKRINDADVVRFREQGLSLTEIGKRVGATKSAVSKSLQKVGLNKPVNKSDVTHFPGSERKVK